MVSPTAQPGAKSPVSLSQMQRAMRAVKSVQASHYDAAEPGLDSNHWSRATRWNANAAMSPADRELIRNRSRYEVANNSYANGIIQTLTNDTIGSGPRLQIKTGDERVDADIECAWREWCYATNMMDKFRVLYRAAPESGEGFAILTTNEDLAGMPVMLDLSLIECDRVTALHGREEPNEVDGVVYDRLWNPVRYRVLKYHPGDYTIRNQDPTAEMWVPRRNMVHWYRPDRPEQMRGVPYITPALPLFAMLRRYTLAVINAAETAASITAILHSMAGAEGDNAVDPDPMDSFPIERDMMWTMPAGWNVNQLKAEQPTGTYKEFQACIINEIARCLNMPYNIAAANSAGHNYSSGRLDHQVYHRTIKLDRKRFEVTVLRRVLREFVREFVTATGQMTDAIQNGTYTAYFQWDTFEHIDQVKAATADQIQIENGTKTIGRCSLERGEDPDEHMQELAEEVRKYAAAGLVHPFAQAVAPKPAPADTNETEDTEEPDEAEADIED